jgi:hypothetical protein
MFKIYPNEYKTFRYWLHLFLDVLLVFILLNKFVATMPITFKTLILGTIILGISDILVHSSLRLN